MTNNTVSNPSKYGIFPLCELDRPAFIAHMLRLDSESRRKRFGAALPDEGVIRACNRFSINKTCAWGLYIWGSLKGTSLVLPYDASCERGEFAITLSQSMRGKGWGKFLTCCALESAYTRGFRFVEINFLRDNEAMGRICARLPGRISTYGSECTKLVDLDAFGQQMMENHGLVTAQAA